MSKRDHDESHTSKLGGRAQPENSELLAAKSKCSRPSDQPEGLGSVDEQCELTVTSQQEIILETDSRELPAGQL